MLLNRLLKRPQRVTIEHMSASPRRVAILGSTGSVGRQALDVIDRHPENLRAVALVAGRDKAGLEQQAARFGIERTGLGQEAAVDFASDDDVDVVLNAIVGAAGLRASVAALSAGKSLALANKESLVAGGLVCAAAAAGGGGRVYPVDSEHAAIARCLDGREADEISRVVLTASGGPFRSRADLSGVTPEEALAHPTWSMGPKITVDSATLMNKGFEVIEAHHLFGFDLDDIDVVVHPQSIVHGIVELTDGSMLMHAAIADMAIPIQMALLDHHGPAGSFGSLDLVEVGELSFEKLDRDRFPAVDLAYEAARKGDTYPAVLNAANEVAVQAFLAGRLSFLDIVGVVADVLADHSPTPADELDAVLDADNWARGRAQELAAARGLSLTGGPS